MYRESLALVVALGLLARSAPDSSANQEQRIQGSDKRITALERELDRLR